MKPRKGPTETGIAFSNRKDVKPGYNAYCDSNRCCGVIARVNARGIRIYKRGAQMVAKDVPLGTDYCPDCHMALRWAST